MTISGAFNTALAELDTLSVSYAGIVTALDGYVFRVSKRGWQVRKTGEWTGVVDFLGGHSLSPEEQAEQEGQMVEAQVELDELLGSARDLVDSADAQYGVLAGAVRAMAPSSWTDQVAAFRAAGIHAPEKTTPVELAALMAEYGQGIDPDRSMSDEQRATLGGFFDMWGTDPVVMSRFFGQLGGEGTIVMTQAAGWTDYGLSCSIRAGLAVGSGRWSIDEADRYLASALSMSDSEVAKAASAIGFLFNGPPYMSASLSWGAANWAETWEKEHGAWGVNHPTWSQVQGRDGTGRYEVPRPCWLDAAEEGWQIEIGAENTHTNIDVSGNILRSLGQYSEESTEWLSQGPDGAVNADRIAYLIEDRDWARYGDGGRDPITLLQATQDPSMLPTDPGIDPSTDSAWKRSATLFATMTTAIMDNESLTLPNPDAGNQVSIDLDVLHPDAVVTLAGVMAGAFPQIQGLWETTLGTPKYNPYTGETIQIRPEAVPGVVPYGATEVPIPIVDVDDLADLIGAAGSTAQGRSVLAGGFEAYREQLVAAARLDSSSVDRQVTGSIDQLAKLAKLIGVESNTAQIDHAVIVDGRLDEAAATRNSAVVTGAGLLTLPFAPGGVAGVLYGVSAVAGQESLGGLLGSFDEPSTFTAEAAHDQVVDQIQDRYHSNREALVLTAVELMGAETLGLPPKPADPGARTQWFDDAYNAVHAHYCYLTGDTRWTIDITINDIINTEATGK